ncbi:hypothetical protein GQF03_07880 [Sneathiella chungangensis]|uniref:Uncharacterized protein n=1 Tax=Sneathiella chungangensis TaxID=1418234 RepID=A0A845MEZ7_9PROT|nr:hypothetical protein [Sneathiella chungangensis]MZR22245.1 hypothetical protein [Sneathiella chungangensis]
MPDKSNILRMTLLIDAGTSLLSGGVALLFAGPLAHWMGMADWVLYTLGAGLVLFAADVAFTATRKVINPLFVKGIIAANVAWVVGSAIALLLFQDRLTVAGSWVVEIIAIAVAVLTSLQAVSLRRLGDQKPRTA